MDPQIVAGSVNSVGLVADIVGAWLLFRYGLPEDVVRQGTSRLILEGAPDKAQVKKAEKYDRRAGWALKLLIAGFALQLISDWVPVVLH